MPKRSQRDQKAEELKQSGTLNPHSETVTDPLFQQNPFFDPRDLLQARYEMLRRHTAEQTSILDAAAAFGVSRPTFYQAQESFQRSGLAGSSGRSKLPRSKGAPREPAPRAEVHRANYQERHGAGQAHQGSR